jgi:hypothetical protein
MRTLLQLTQSILNDVDGDEVNSISDTIEAEQAAQLLIDTYLEMVSELDLPEADGLLQLHLGTGNIVLKTPDDVMEIEWIKYNKADLLTGVTEDDFTTLAYVEPSTFLQRASRLVGANLSTVQIQGHTVKYRNDLHPVNYTILSNETILFDSLNEAIDHNGIVEAKLLAYGSREVVPSKTDSFKFNCNRAIETRILNTAKEMFFDLYKDGAPRAVMRKRSRSEVRVQRAKHTAAIQNRGRAPDYGRK